MSRQTIDLAGHCLTRELSGSLDFAALHHASRDRYPFLLQSTATGSPLGEFDILFAFPGAALVLSDTDQLTGPGSDVDADFLQGLNRWWNRERQSDASSSLPFSGGWFLYLGYELAAQVESGLQLLKDKILPTAFAVRCPAAFVYDHQKDAVFIVCETASAECIRLMLSDAEALANNDSQVKSDKSTPSTATEENPEFYLEAVRAAKEYIAAGDIFQANLSRSWQSKVDASRSADELYSRLCQSNPAPFAGMVRWRDTTIISSSPERLLSVREQQISTRPIAGTRPRGANDADDNALSEELFDHPKERAEHVMLIDLERNDLGRVCVPGSVTVSEFMVLESYAHVHHIVSNVCGTLRSDVGPGDAIRAVFPGGTITGCPKVRCMEIISELEQRPRGAYTGSFGYLNLDGSLDLNILIRTMVMFDDIIELRAGSGIVADSDPHAELAETRDKAKGLLMALQ